MKAKKYFQMFAVALALLSAGATGVMAASVAPILVNPWQSGDAGYECAAASALTGVTYMYYCKIDNWEGDMNGTYTCPLDFPKDYGDNVITISNSNGIYFDWSATNAIGAVIVKGGKAANIFAYPTPASSDTGLYSPNNPSGNPAAVSHVSFCWNLEETAYMYETAYAFGGDPSDCFIGNGFSKWGWSNGPITEGTYTWPLYAGAAHCDLTKGTLVGTVNVIYAGGYVDVAINLLPGITIQESHVYASSNMFPMFKGKPTVAPGQYTNIGPFSGAIYVIVHAVVGIPVVP